MAQESADGYNTMSEDCLKLNVWSKFKPGDNRPVMVFVYGGGEIPDLMPQITSRIQWN